MLHCHIRSARSAKPARESPAAAAVIPMAETSRGDPYPSPYTDV